MIEIPTFVLLFQNFEPYFIGFLLFRWMALESLETVNTVYSCSALHCLVCFCLQTQCLHIFHKMGR